MDPQALELAPQASMRYGVICLLEVNKARKEGTTLGSGAFYQCAEDQGLVSGTMSPTKARLAPGAQAVPLTTLSEARSCNYFVWQNVCASRREMLPTSSQKGLSRVGHEIPLNTNSCADQPTNKRRVHESCIEGIRHR